MKRSFYFTEHALDEMEEDDLEIEDVMRIAEHGAIIENYINDKPYPSCLKLGWTALPDRNPVHVVCAQSPDRRIHIITTYKPEHAKWDKEFKIRKK